MSGSMGFGKTGELIRTILEAEGCGVEILAVCGSNTKLRNRLCKDFGENANVHPIGFTDRVPLLMDACDVLFTKPGGHPSDPYGAHTWLRDRQRPLLPLPRHVLQHH